MLTLGYSCIFIKKYDKDSKLVFTQFEVSKPLENPSPTTELFNFPIMIGN